MNNDIKKILDTPIFIIDNEGFTVYINDTINDYITNLQKELDQYKNNWEELKKMFEADEHFEDGCYCSKILNKMKELEEDK